MTGTGTVGGVEDTLGMVAATLGLPDQLERAVAATASVDGLPDASGVTSVLLLGMGGSGIGGEVAVAVAGPRCRVPLLLGKQYEVPGFVGPSTLVVACSFSGNTEETLSATRTALEAGARVVAVTAGGELAELARAAGAPVVPLDASIPMPRAAIGAVSVPLLLLLERLGFVDGMTAEVESAVARLRERLADPGTEGLVGRLARGIGRTFPLVYGGGLLGEVAAVRWKNQCNENPKIPAFAHRVPELMHNEIAGWAQHGDVTRQVLTMVLLRHDYEHPQVRRRFELIEEICDEVVSDVLVVEAVGATPLAQLMDLVLVGDLVSLRLAANEGVDPGPIPVLDDIKRRLRG